MLTLMFALVLLVLLVLLPRAMLALAWQVAVMLGGLVRLFVLLLLGSGLLVPIALLLLLALVLGGSLLA